ncbi:dipeptide epimerase [Streptomyces zagrosensis]|uniref:Dipeptide epimerase n=1 Tax=Streptomyces zagrosensis TaxID=1042984 RepID=A0A7W9QCP2_9ACTN|nr:dipeptide epimerase [Streptomyces zagrosensis]MBB5937856.1 L-alanine-DL-glutamate epimerase-like enolase superfamily enzyme [Streptomyces zagrosensis]
MKTTLRTTRLQLAEPLRISRSVMDARDAVWLSIEHRGLRGHGEVVASVYFGLDTETIGRLLTDAALDLARYPDPETALGAVRARELPADGMPPAIVAAVEAALLDLVGKRAGAPVHHLIGTLTPPVAATARTIGITTAISAAVRARCLAENGFRTIKVKVGTADAEEDLERVRIIRAEAPGLRLLLDPNGAWTVAETHELLPRYADLGVEAVEQPIAPGDPDALAAIAERSPLPIIADEDAVSYEDVRRLAGRVQGVNVKLAKCGGVHAALRIGELIAGSGTSLMLGCLTASSLGIAPAVHLADRARWVDLDGHLLLADDPWTGIGGTDGIVRASARAGLGVRPVRPDAREEGTAERPPRQRA